MEELKLKNIVTNIPEVLAPAGSLEKLKVAILYGADAVYLGGQKYSLRSAADNFTEHELIEGISFAHQRGRKVYVVLNSFFHDDDFNDLPEFIKLLDSLKVDALIVSDLGVIEMIKKCRLRESQMDIHLSTQASCLNIESAKFWKGQGVSRIVLGREVSILEAHRIEMEAGIEVELFVHGSMCMAYSGNCTISNYTQGRDSNRGGCAHSCRFEYEMDFLKRDSHKAAGKNAFFMSSKDLKGINILKNFIEYGISSLKIEGRMKSHHYVGTVTKVYKSALKQFKENGHLLSDDLKKWNEELEKISHRDYSDGSLLETAGDDSIYNERENEASELVIAGVVVEVVSPDFLLVEVRSQFSSGDLLELVPFVEENQKLKLTWIKTFDNQLLDKTNPGTLVKIPYVSFAQEYNLIRGKALL